MDYSDVDADRQASRGWSRSRSRSRTPRADDNRRPLSRSRSPPRRRYRDDSRSPPPPRGDYDDRRDYSDSRREYDRDRTPDRSRYSRDDRTPPATNIPPPKPKGAPEHVDPSNVVGVFGLSIRTREEDLEHEFGRIAPVEKVVIVYDARSGRSRGFGFITMKDKDGASDVIKALNGKDLHGRRIRVDFSTTRKPHDPTPGVYKGEPRADDRSFRSESRYGGSSGGGGGGSSYRRGGDSYYARGPPAGGRGGDSYRRRYDADASDDWRRPARRDRDRRSISPPRRRDYSRSPSPRRYDREERVPPPSRSRHGSHLDSPPRDEEVEPARYY